MPLIGFQYEPVGLDVNEICCDVEQDMPEKLRKIQKVNEWCRCGKCGVMDMSCA